MTDQFLEELTREAERSARTLDVVPMDQAAWKPHEKSMALGQLAQLVSMMPQWIAMIINMDELELNPPAGSDMERPKADTAKDLVTNQAKFVEDARAALKGTNDEHLLSTNWKLKFNGNVVMDQPRYIVIRETFNHLAHHRGQLTVYLRLKDVPVPAIYGPSADDKRFA